MLADEDVVKVLFNHKDAKLTAYYDVLGNFMEGNLRSEGTGGIGCRERGFNKFIQIKFY